MQAVILAGGKGTRLRPFTTSLPKPLVPLGEQPIIEVILRQLKAAGFKEVVVSVGHLAELIAAYCGDGKRWGLRLRYAREAKPLSTAGALREISGLAPNFLTINGDILTTLSAKALFADHMKSKAHATVAVCQRTTTVSFGVITLDAKKRVTAYTEKPSLTYSVSMGVNVFSRESLKLIKKGEALGIPEFIDRIRAKGGLVRGYPTKAEWLDIGRPEDYETAQAIFDSPRLRARYLP
ncbi:MAG: NTP transferase domain-containing protein [Elusimicrobia bacterium]|nr:NTP transferase domain-containing protein [Elusimicrobiota bacterium]